MATVRVPLSSRKYPGMVALVDDADATLAALYTWFPVCKRGIWYAAGDGPRTPGKHGRKVYLHRLILGEPPTGDVDHINGDGLDCRRCNLRHASHSQNLCNQGKPAHNTSGYKGVSWQRQIGRWRAKIGVRGKRISLGCYGTAEEAAHAYDAGARLHHGEFAQLNFP